MACLRVEMHRGDIRVFRDRGVDFRVVVPDREAGRFLAGHGGHQVGVACRDRAADFRVVVARVPAAVVVGIRVRVVGVAAVAAGMPARAEEEVVEVEDIPVAVEVPAVTTKEAFYETFNHTPLFVRTSRFIGSHWRSHHLLCAR